MRYLLWGAKKRQMMLLNFLIIYFLLSDAQPDFSRAFHKDFPHIAQAR